MDAAPVGHFQPSLAGPSAGPFQVHRCALGLPHMDEMDSSQLCQAGEYLSYVCVYPEPQIVTLFGNVVFVGVTG